MTAELLTVRLTSMNEILALQEEKMVKMVNVVGLLRIKISNYEYSQQQGYSENCQKSHKSNYKSLNRLIKCIQALAESTR